MNRPGKVFFVGAGPGDPELVTIKAKRLIEQADVLVYSGSLVSPELLKYAKPGAELYDSASRDREEIFRIMRDAAKEGKLVARVHDGDPSIFSAAQEQIDCLEEEGIECEIVPGVSSMLAAAARLKRELTLPGLAQTIIVSRPELRTKVPEAESLRELAKHRATIVLFLGVHLIERIVKELVKGGYPPDTPVAVVYRATWPDEKVVVGKLEEIAKKVKALKIVRTAIIIVGEAVSPKRYEYSRVYDPAFTHSFRRAKLKEGLSKGLKKAPQVEASRSWHMG